MKAKQKITTPSTNSSESSKALTFMVNLTFKLIEHENAAEKNHSTTVTAPPDDSLDEVERVSLRINSSANSLKTNNSCD